MLIVKFLIIRFSSIGDIVLTTPVIRALKQQVENAEVHFLTKNQYLTVVENNAYIDKIHLLKKDFSELISELKKEHFHYIIDLHKNLRTFRVKNKLRKVSFSFDKINYEKWLIVNLKKNKLPEKHIVERYLDCTKVFDTKNDGKGLDYFISELDKVDIKSSFPDLFHNGYIAFVIGAQHYTKKIPLDIIIKICKKINKAIIILGGKEDVGEGEQIDKATDNNVFNACGKFSLNQSASIVEQAKLVISHDTGLMHIAAAFKKKIVSVWGNTIPQFGMYPYLPQKDSKIIEVENLKCRPCSKIGFSKCPKKHFKCMREINIDKIIEIANE